MNNQVQAVEQKSPFAVMAGRLSVDPATVEGLILNTLMTAKDKGGQVTHDEVMVFMSIANEYRLNPLTKEIYAFNNRGAIQPIVSIDGWLRIINPTPQYDGVEFDDISKPPVRRLTRTAFNSCLPLISKPPVRRLT